MTAGRADYTGIFPEPFQIEMVILIGEETGLAIVPALNDVQRRIGKHQARTARHGDRENVVGEILH